MTQDSICGNWLNEIDFKRLPVKHVSDYALKKEKNANSEPISD